MIRTNSILVTKYILKILEENKPIVKFFNDRIFPIDANFGTKYPFVAIVRTGMMPASTKDGLYEDRVYFSAVISGDTYKSSLEGANLVRSVLDHTYYIDSEIAIKSIILDNSTETWIDGKFYQELMFTATVQLPQI